MGDDLLCKMTDNVKNLCLLFDEIYPTNTM